MGLSASQARLLSVTKRINNNELKSQILANNRIQLATKNTDATRKYIEALEATKMQYVSYDEGGSQQKIALTFNALDNYNPLKNQYAIFNSENQIYVNAKDAENFENSKTLYEFLEKYDLIENRKAIIENPDWIPAVNKYHEDYTNWQLEEPKIEDYTTTSIASTKWIHSNSEVYDAISDISCFSITQSGERCYMHVLAALLGFGTFTTSDGNTFEIKNKNEIGWQWNSCSTEEEAVMQGLREELKNDTVSDLSYDGILNTESHGNVPVKGDGTDAAKYNAPGGGKCWQKCIDLMWELHFGYDGSSTGGTATPEELKKFWYFVEVDLGDGYLQEETETNVDQESFDNAYAEWLSNEPQYPDIPKTIEQTFYDKINDKPKAQWYTNLWNLMDGHTDSDKIIATHNELDEIGHFTVADSIKTSTNKSNYYKVIPENLANDSNWLQFALTNGLVTLSQAGLRSAFDEFKITWERVDWTSTTDITEVQDDTKVARAEAKYQETIKQIQYEDKVMETDIKKLDTEHTELKSEYESIKKVMSKNIERSFNAFS